MSRAERYDGHYSERRHRRPFAGGKGNSKRKKRHHTWHMKQDAQIVKYDSPWGVLAAAMDMATKLFW